MVLPDFVSGRRFRDGIAALGILAERREISGAPVVRRDEVQHFVDVEDLAQQFGAEMGSLNSLSLRMRCE
jgi:hypothetical protein